MHSSTSKRHLSRRRHGVNALVDREPALINIPGLVLPSIPLLSPLLNPLITPIIDGVHSTSTTPAVSSTPTPSQSPPSDGGSDSGSSSGGSSGGGNSGSGDGGSSSGTNSSGSGSGTTNNGGTSSGSGSSSGNDNGNSNGNGNSGGNNGSPSGGSTPTSGGNPGPSSGSTHTQGAGTSPSGTASAAGSADPSAATFSSAALPSSGAVLTTESSANNNAAEAVSNVAANVDTDHSNNSNGNVNGSSNGGGSTSSIVGGHSSGTVTGTISAPTSVGSTTAGVGSGGTGGTDPTDASAAASSHGLSGGAIGGIVVGVLALFALLFFVLRRRAQNRRKERHTRWLFFAGENEPKYENAPDPLRQRQSQRSSFGTPFNGSLFSDETGRISPMFGDIPSFPPMVQVHNAHIAPLVVTVTTDEFVVGQRTSVFSVGSSRSSSSFSDDHDGQVLTMPPAIHDGRGVASDSPNTPMSVRPFSPSESFSFPKPPERQSMAPSTIHSPATIRADVNPFADPERARISGSLMPFGLLSEKQSLDPFSDPSERPARPATPSSYGSGSFIAGTRETVSRPFTPTMPDELLVIPGEEVVIIQAFDDGWAQVQNGRKEIGLIPFDCFRPRGEELPSFLASKRVSSYLGGSISA